MIRWNRFQKSDRTSVDALVLLGNCYRHLGQFARSRQAIEHALQLKPDYHYALYALGKLNLVTGAYHDASESFEQALASGAPDLIQFDMGQANFLLGDSESATKHLSRFCFRATDEPEKLMLATYLLHIMGAGEQPSAAEIHEHISYWREEALKYAATDFGKALQSQVDELSHEDSSGLNWYAGGFSRRHLTLSHSLVLRHNFCGFPGKRGGGYVVLPHRLLAPRIILALMRIWS